MVKNLNKYPKIMDIVVLIFCGYVIIWYLQIGIRWPSLGAIRIEFYYALFLIVLSIFYSGGFKIHGTLKIALFFFILFLIIQVPLSYDV